MTKSETQFRASNLTDSEQEDIRRLKRLFDEKAGLSQKDFGSRWGIGSPGMMSQYLTGKRSLGLAAAIKFAKGLGVEVVDISPTLARQLPPSSQTPAASDAVMPAVIEQSRPPAGHVRLQVLEAAPSAGPGSEPADYAAVLGHIDLAEQWARKRLGDRLDHIRALPVKGDSMSPTINDGDLAFVDTGCNHFEGEGVYVLVFNHALLIKRLSADFATQRIQILSDNERHKPALAREDELTICGRVRMWMAVKGY
jgi:phage repressor protein C with HTH and peptisase S24 domain